MPRPVDRARWPLSIDKAEEFLRVARACEKTGDWNAGASASVHAAIMACDALTVSALGVRNSGDHKGLAPLVAKALAKSPADAADVRKRILRLLDTKRLAEYDDRPVSAAEATACRKDAERIRDIAKAHAGAD
ncbi:MAG: HEPN domain-containing protein [Euryarchaeota archaeon]|nr:HEPN domain-containing protein [Euryarchaeota archaeon]